MNGIKAGNVLNIREANVVPNVNNKACVFVNISLRLRLSSSFEFICNDL